MPKLTRVAVPIEIQDSCQILMKIEFSRPIFEKFSDVKFHEKASNSRNDKSTLTIRRLSQFCEHTKKFNSNIL